MYKKLLITALIIGCAALLAIIVFQDQDTEKPIFSQEVEIETDTLIVTNSPDTCAIGEMVEIDASESTATAFKWMVIPQTKNFRVIDDGRRALFCSGTPGIYLFVIAAADGSGTLKITKVEVVVTQPELVIPTPEDAFTIKIRSWLPSNPDPLILEKLARSFERVASAGHTDVAVFVKTTALSNRGILGPNLMDWTPFLKEFSGYLKINLTDESIEKHVELWFNLASTLRSLK